MDDVFRGSWGMNCAICVTKECREGMDCTDIRGDVINVYKDRKNRKILRVASIIDSEFSMRMNRLQELMLFCRKMGYRHLGIAFCISLEEEMGVLHDILAKRFRISSVCCKVCGINRKAFDLPNQNRTDLNIIFGLCMGNDILFSKYSDAPVTTLVVKDRILANNPIGAIYSTHYRKEFWGV
jgi:uncharacterized metal-binding protein